MTAWLLILGLTMGIATANPTGSSRQSPTSTMTIEIPMGEVTVSLDMTKSDISYATLPVFLGTDRRAHVQMDTPDHEDFAVYYNTENNASMVMWSMDEATGAPAGMMGLFDLYGETFSLEPMDMDAISRRARDPEEDDERDATVEVTVGGHQFAMGHVDRARMMYGRVAAAEQKVNEQTMKLDHDVQKFVEESRGQGHEYPRFRYVVELFHVADYATFHKWFSASRASDYRGKEAEAVDHIRYYFAHVLNAVAMRYLSADNSEIQIRIQPVGIYIAKTPKASYWTELAPNKEGSSYTEAYLALDTFEEWINREAHKLPSFDQATLFTSNYLFSGYHNGRRRTIYGLADIMGVCSDRRASINYDLGIYGSIQNGAHELAHNLGAYHDGYSNPCRSSDQYIMAVSPGQLDSQTFDNPLSFSRCSMTAFKNFFLFLTRNGTNCLLEAHSFRTEWDFDRYLTSYLGQRYSADEQCMSVHGMRSFYCGGGNRDESICSSMYCWAPAERQCQTHVEQRAADGTACGDGMWCMQSRCVRDSRAPGSDRPDCVYGDYRGVIDSRNGFTCEDVRQREPSRCYNDRYRAQCCQACADVNSGDVSCPFGDCSPSYCRTTIRAQDCYAEGTRRECCATCGSIDRQLGSPGCEYGDRASDCSGRGSNPATCYHDNSTCCSTCPSLQTGPEGCEWGDKVTWCRGISRMDCYRRDYRENCCVTCPRLQLASAVPGCEWGDRTRYCTSSDCRRASGRRDCCRTCEAFFSTTSTTTTTVVTSTLSTTPARQNPTSSTRAPATAAPTTCTDVEPEVCAYKISGSARYCYDFDDVCCATCAPFKTGVQGCEYGDKFSWCDVYVAKNGRDVCALGLTVGQGYCAACATDTNGPTTQAPDCLDEANWCPEINPGQCYNEKTESLCCHTCRTYWRPERPSCLYGDLFSWCHLKYCRTEAENCCDTCRDFL